MTVLRSLAFKIIPNTTFTKAVRWQQPVLDGNGRQLFDASGQPMWTFVDTTGCTAEFTVGVDYSQPPPFAVDITGVVSQYGQVTVDAQGNFLITVTPAGTARVKSNMVHKLSCIMPGTPPVIRDIVMGSVETS